MSAVDDVEDQAMAWIVRLDALSDADTDTTAAQSVRAEFAAWCDADPRQHAAYIRLSVAWRKADRLSRLYDEDGTVDIDLLAPEPAVSSPGAHSKPAWILGFMRARVALAASVAVVLVAVSGWLAFDQLSGRTYATAVGGFERVPLADGSTVQLDTNSKIKVRFTGADRHVVLIRGQANFDVAPDAQRPFSVDAGGAVVRALGTAFSVRLRDAQVEVLVTEGRVAITVPKSGVYGRDGDEPRKPSTLSAGEAATIKTAQPSIRPVKVEAPDIVRRLSWTRGRATFDGETLAEAVAEFNRYTRRQLVIVDPAIAGIRVGGSFEPNDPESFVAALERSFGVKVQSANDEEVRLVSASN